MPAIINGPLEISTIGGTGIVNFGGSVALSPKTASKTFVGSGGFSTAGIIVNTNGFSNTNVIDSKVIDQPITHSN